ncbi:putative ubiquitin-conjugating enzyme E2 38 [Lotus japonicus]|uniref:putative ubiquitin-conjugating enzyme E2 38 n=1 Tax=Lotus japonicus TaxID=34305 RepID=UPI00258681F9|nr:putative ubiquitin-conjugating enzyme E2 38 [Lotus japonicus]
MEEIKTTNEFRNFEVVPHVSDHHFLNKSRDSITDNPNCRAHKRIMEEWETLEQNLPESIYVRVYKNRIDLMRAVIVGAAGTPYHNGLFFFDIAFPSNYPQHPPMVNFTSSGLRLNPNLHVNGEVIMSLLSKSEIVEENCETWDPSESTSLQVLLSLQKHILNKEPFYNDPRAAYFRRFNMDGDSSRAYNERVYSFTCHLTLYLMLNPPTDFKAFVIRHFCDRAPAILSAFKEYVNGSLSVENYVRMSSLPVKVSPKFKEWVKDFYPLMFQMFTLFGASFDASFNSLELPSEPSESHNPGGIKKRGILPKLMKVIKSSFVLD